MSDPAPMFTAVPPKPDGTPGADGLPGYAKMFPADVQGDQDWKAAFAKYGTIADFLKAAKPVFTRNLVPVPDDKSTPEEKKAFLKAAGVPDSPDQYEILDYADVPLTDDQKKNFRDTAFKRGLTTQQAKVWYEAEIESARGHAKRQTEAKSKLENERKVQMMQRWGAETPIKEDRYVKTLPTLPEGLRKALSDAGVLDHPDVKDYIQGLYKEPDRRPEASRGGDQSREGGLLFNYKT